MLVWLPALLGGCNLVFGLDEPGVTGDGDGGDGPPPIDAPVEGGDDAIDGPPFDPVTTPWGSFRYVVITKNEERSPALSPDGTELYFAHTPTGGDIEIYRSPRIGNAWGPFTRVDELASPQSDLAPRFVDPLIMFLASNRAGGAGGYDIWFSTRVTTSSAWSVPGVVPAGINTTFNELSYSGCDDSDYRVFASDRGGANDYDLYQIVDSVVTAIPIASSGAAQEVSPFLMPDCLTLYFASNVQGSYDLFVSRRASLAAAWSNPRFLDELSAPEAEELDPWVTPDERHIYFVAGDPGGYDLLEATR